MGFASAFGRIGSVVMPYILLELFAVNFLYPLIAFAVASAFIAVGAYLIPYDTTWRVLDEGNGTEMTQVLLKKDGF